VKPWIRVEICVRKQAKGRLFALLDCFLDGFLVRASSSAARRPGRIALDRQRSQKAAHGLQHRQPCIQQRHKQAHAAGGGCSISLHHVCSTRGREVSAVSSCMGGRMGRGWQQQQQQLAPCRPGGRQLEISESAG
jgi:hypothetical protein